MYCVILSTKRVFFIFVNIQKAMDTFNLLTRPVCEFYTFYFSYPIVTFFHWQINTYLRAYLPEHSHVSENYF